MIPMFAKILLYTGSGGTSKVTQGVSDNMSATEICIQMKRCKVICLHIQPNYKIPHSTVHSRNKDTP